MEKKKFGFVKATIVLIFFFSLLSAIMNRGGSQPDADQKKNEAVDAKCASSDLDCRGSKAMLYAELLCKSAIEQSAANNFRWVDSFLEPKFSRYRWTKKPSGRITMIGDKIEFMNGYGAYFPMTYECDLGDEDRTALRVRVQKGRLSK